VSRNAESPRFLRTAANRPRINFHIVKAGDRMKGTQRVIAMMSLDHEIRKSSEIAAVSANAAAHGSGPQKRCLDRPRNSAKVFPCDALRTAAPNARSAAPRALDIPAPHARCRKIGPPSGTRRRYIAAFHVDAGCQ